MCIRKVPCLIFFSMVMLLPFTCFAQLQRMAILSGEYNLSPRSSEQVDAYCMDYTRHAPAKGSSYRYLLTPSENATVTIGNSQRIGLQDAISQGLISIEGTNPTFGQLLNNLADPMALNRLPAEQRTQIIEARNLWNTLTADQKRALEREFAPEMAKFGGDFTHLVLVNHTAQPVSISLRKDSVFGSAREAAPLIASETTTGRNRTSGQADIQAQFWRAATRKHQAMLQDAGYYKGSLSGEVDDATEKAIIGFKSDHNLTRDSIIDSETESALIRAAQDSRNAKYLALTLETGGGGELYRLYEPGGKQIYSGNQIEDLIIAINTERGHKGRGNNVYLIMKGFSPTQTRAFAASTRIHQNAVDSAVSIRPFESADATGSEEFFFSPGKTLLEGSVTEPVLVTEGTNQNLYLSSFKVSDAAGESGTVSVFARAREVVTSFVRGVKELFQVRKDSWSVAKIVNVARSQMRKRFDVNDDNLRIEFKDQFGRSHIVKLRFVSADDCGNAE